MVFIICLSQNVTMLKNQLLNAPEFVRRHSPITGEADARLQPELTLAI